MFTTRTIAAAALLASAAIAPASAQEKGEYVLIDTEQGYVRMHTGTGEMSMCREQNGQMICKLAADERAAFQDQLEELEGRVERLEAMAAGEGFTREGLPSDEEIDRGLDTMEKFFDRFMGIIDRFEEEDRQPDRT